MLNSVTAKRRRAFLTRYVGPALLLAAVVQSCSNRESALNGETPRPDTMLGVPAVAVSTIEVRARPELRENSAAVMSALQGGVFFTINDSGNEPILFALDTLGADRGAWRLVGARNDDWEAAALGPCATNHDTDPGAGQCIYIGDVGDNAARHATRTLYRAREPTAREPRAGPAEGYDALRAERLPFRYEDGPHDVEAMYVGANATTWLITKRRLRDANGRARPALLFALDGAAWSHPGTVAVARLVDSLPVTPGSAPGRLLTDAALSPDGRLVAIRTYTQVFVFRTDSLSGRPRSDEPPAACDIAGLEERQGEGIAWMRPQGPLLLTSEGRGEPLRVVSCPLPP